MDPHRITRQGERTMPDPTDDVRAAVANLADTDEDDLYRLLALRVKTIEKHPAMAGEFAPTTMAATELGIAMPDLHALGRKLFGKTPRAGRSFFCGPN